jgi:alkanesulfonate monooxygenase SsuD/methylene tetrahydromethanopterin reductase-like flavin-dependent oxidoreductase (luciferase family)
MTDAGGFAPGEEQRVARRGFGVAGALDQTLIQTIAAAVEQAGYDAFWANDTPNGDGLSALAAAAEVTGRVKLGVGVIPVDRQPAEAILRKVHNLNLPTERLVIGIGSGGMHNGGLERVREAAEQLSQKSDATVLVGALGPKMCRVAGEAADGVLLNWLTPRQAAASAAIVRDAAEQHGRSNAMIAAYVRVALGEASRPKLEGESRFYGRIPQYARHFEKMTVQPIETTVFGDTREALQAGLAPFDQVLDETIVRAVTAEDTEAAYMALVRAAAPAASR